MGSDGIDLYSQMFKNVVTSRVVPCMTDPVLQTMNLTHLDYLHMDRYVRLLFLYQLTNNSDEVYSRFVHSLKESLGKALVSFFPLASSVVKTGDAQHPRQLRYTALGVPFTEAFLDEDMENVCDLEDFQPIPYLSGLEPAGQDSLRQIQLYPESGCGLPSLIVQVTRFKCGSVCLAVSWTHLVADMMAFMRFMEAWSELTRTGETAICADHNNFRLKSANTASSDKHEEKPKSKVEDLPRVNPNQDDRTQKVLHTKFSLKMIHLRREAIAAMKEEALHTAKQTISTMDCVSAHLWRGVARAYASCGLSDVTVFSTTVEGRQKLSRSPNFFGNCVAMAHGPRMPASQLLKDPLSAAAVRIRHAIEGVTRDTYLSIIDKMDLTSPWNANGNRTDSQLVLTSWKRFPLAETDFGVGKPIYSGHNFPPSVAKMGQCIVMPRAGTAGDISVSLYLHPQILEALWADPEFLSLS